MIGKSAYLRQLTASTMPMQSVAMGKDLAGSSPPSVFIGSWNYPHVYAGPLVTPVHGDTAIMDTPEDWISGKKTQEEIIGYRMGLVRGKRMIDAADLDTRFVEQLQEWHSAASRQVPVFPKNIPPLVPVRRSNGSLPREDAGTATWRRSFTTPICPRPAP
jgi:hypothetical protein